MVKRSVAIVSAGRGQAAWYESDGRAYLRCIRWVPPVNTWAVSEFCDLGAVEYPAGMRHFGIILTAGLLAAGGVSAETCSGVTFEGAWFDVTVPAEFKATPLLPGLSSDGHDSASFTSPDGSVSFYVFAPQWSGNPLTIAIDPETEVLRDETTSVLENGVKNRWWTIDAKDGSYARSYHEVTDAEGTSRHVIGTKYASVVALQTYGADYACFKNSLERYLD